VSIREVILTNIADMKQVLNSLCIPAANVQFFNYIKSNINFEILSIEKQDVIVLRNISSDFPSVQILVSDEKDNLYNCILSLPGSVLRAFVQNLSHVSEGNLKDIGKEINRIQKCRSIQQWEFSAQGKSFTVQAPMIMGILNVTPDSFSDGGNFLSQDSAYRRAMEMLEAGSHIIDIGGESTRPGAEAVPLEEEWKRISPVIRQLSGEDCIISVDTYKSEIARRSLLEGAHIINDISGLTFDPKMVEVVAEFQVPIVIMHIKGTPRNMQKNPHYENLMEEIFQFLHGQIQFARQNGVRQLILDPGIGFGKRLEDNFEIIRRLGEFRQLGYPILLGSSRKSFIGNILNRPPSQRLMGTVTTVILGILNGAHILRVHDVTEIGESLEILKAVMELKAH